jgi:hypothetical protein
MNDDWQGNQQGFAVFFLQKSATDRDLLHGAEHLDKETGPVTTRCTIRAWQAVREENRCYCISKLLVDSFAQSIVLCLTKFTGRYCNIFSNSLNRCFMLRPDPLQTCTLMIQFVFCSF